MIFTTTIKGELQIDHKRGVIYFHSDINALKVGYCPTPLRICGLGEIKAPLQDRQIDLTVLSLVIQDHEIKEVRIVK